MSKSQNHSASTNLLLYAFEPFGGLPTNISQKVLEKLKGSGVVKLVLPVERDNYTLLAALDRYQPQFVVGMGLHPRARKIRIERVAHNLWHQARAEKPRVLFPRDPLYTRYATIPLKKTRYTTITYDAGYYVCNWSMWVTSTWAQDHAAQWGFLHIPRHMPVELATKECTKLLLPLFKCLP
jgi:pyrrolidone-carboxylate peptidase